MKIQFCPYCGTKLDKGARFCKSCGEIIAHDTQEFLQTKSKQPTTENLSERKIVYEGYLHKCPNCGEVLNSFMTNCPTCGYELRNVKVASTVQELTRKLELIEAQKIPITPIEPIEPFSVPKPFENEQKSVMKRLLGWDFNESNRREVQQEVIEAAKKAREQELSVRLKDARLKEKKFEEQKNREKANLIQNFPVPNAKEDMLEFVLLVSTNINAKNITPNVVSEAWMAKLNQVYQKAEISFNGNVDFERIKSIYQQINEVWKKLRIRYLLKSTAIFILKNLITWSGLIAFLIAIRMDQAGDNSSGAELIGMALLITSAAILRKRKANYLEFVIVALSGALVFMLKNFMANGSVFALTGIIVLIIVAYSVIKSMIKRDL